MPKPKLPARPRTLAVMVLIGAALSGCGWFKGWFGKDAPHTYVLSLRQPLAVVAPKNSPVLLVSPTKAWPGYDVPRIAYIKDRLRLDYYADNEWADQPARMIEPLLVRALEASGAYSAVLSTPGTANADLRLDTEIVSLHQDFQREPSTGRATIRAQLVDVAKNQVLRTRSFETSVAAKSDDASGGVTAMNKAVEHAIQEIVTFTMRDASGDHK